MSAMDDLYFVNGWASMYAKLTDLDGSTEAGRELLERSKRLSAICKAFDEAGDARNVVSRIRSADPEWRDFELDSEQAADLIRAHVAHETVAKDKRIAELEAGRENLEWLVFYALGGVNYKIEPPIEPIISISRGRELLGFESMNEMRDWYRAYQTKEALAGQAKEEGR